MAVKIDNLEADLVSLRLLLEDVCFYRKSAISTLWKLQKDNNFLELPIEDLTNSGVKIMEMQKIFNRLFGGK